jgi:hypothetical protein
MSGSVATPDHPHVGRGGVKLAHALEMSAFSGWILGLAIEPRPAGSPTCSCSVARRASLRRRKYGQLDWKIRSDPRVDVIERRMRVR